LGKVLKKLRKTSYTKNYDGYKERHEYGTNYEVNERVSFFLSFFFNVSLTSSLVIMRRFKGERAKS
jgi:hypothetical protein